MQIEARVNPGVFGNLPKTSFVVGGTRTMRRALLPIRSALVPIGLSVLVLSSLPPKVFAAPPVKPSEDDVGSAVSKVLNRARAAAAQMKSADRLLESGNIASACNGYEATRRLLPSWWLPHLALVRCGRLLGVDSTALLEHATYAVKVRPKIPATHLQLAMTLEDLGRLDAAAAALEAALKLRPDFFQARYRLGLIRAQQGNNESAVHHLNQTLLAYPGHVVALHHLANLHEALGHVDAAANTLTQLLSVSLHPRTVYSRLVRLLARHKRKDELRRLKRQTSGAAWLQRRKQSEVHSQDGAQ